MWDDTVERWTKEGCLASGEDVIEHFDMEQRAHGWLEGVADLDFGKDVLEETEDMILELDGNGATLRWFKNRSGTPENVAYAVKERGDWEEKIKWRYDPRDAERFPDDFEERCRALKDRDYVLRLTVPGPFWQLREWCGFEGLCLMLVDDPALVLEMAAFWDDFVLRMLELILERVELSDLRWRFMSLARRAGILL